jgi:hypothetical protein
MYRLSFFLTARQRRLLASQAAQTGLTQAELIRRALDAWLTPLEAVPTAESSLAIGDRGTLHVPHTAELARLQGKK